MNYDSTGHLYSGNAWKTAAAVFAGIWVPFYLYPITKVDKPLLAELATHDTWLGRRLKAQYVKFINNNLFYFSLMFLLCIMLLPLFLNFRYLNLPSIDVLYCLLFISLFHQSCS